MDMGKINTLQFALVGFACTFRAAHACVSVDQVCPSIGHRSGCWDCKATCPDPSYWNQYAKEGLWGQGLTCDHGGAACNVFGCNCVGCDCDRRRLQERNECDNFNSYMSMTDDEKVAHLGAFHCKSAAALSDAHTQVETFIDSIGDNNGELTCDEFNTAYHEVTSLEICEHGFLHAKRFPSEMTCGEVKEAYKANECCGNPSKTWDGKLRRLMPEVLKQGALSDASFMALAQLKFTLQEKNRTDKAGAAKIAQSIMAITEKYTGPLKF